MPIRVLELFAGVGGCAAALGPACRVVGALDQSADARAVYRRNFPGAPWSARNLDHVGLDELARYRADLWWLSPPCEPYTARGARRDLDDPRAASLVRLLELLPLLRPPLLALENVQGFPGSRAHALLLATLARAGYQVRERLLCPTDLGVPMRRPRWYLAAARAGLAPERPPPQEERPLATCLDTDPDPALDLAPDLLARYGAALDVLDPDDARAVATCVTAGYGHAVVGAGSVVRGPRGLRYLSPAEIARLLGFPPAFAFPPDLPLRTRWRLLGNSLSVDAARVVLSALGAS